RNQVGWRRIQGVSKGGRLAVEASVTERAVHGVELDAVDEVLVVGHEGVGDARGVALHGGIDGSDGEMPLQMRRRDIGGSGKKAEARNAESGKNQDDK